MTLNLDKSGAATATRSRDTSIAYVALGSNLGDRWQLLTHAVRSLGEVRRTSRVFETTPIGCPDGAGLFLNAVVELQTASSPIELLDRCLAIEEAAGRERIVRWDSRTLDLDLLWFADLHLVSERLTLPHPRMFERSFVLTPLADLAPGLIPASLKYLVGTADIVPVGRLPE